MALSVATGTFSTGTAAAGNTVSVTGLSFQPKFVLLLWAGRTATGQAEGDHKFGVGYAVSTTDRGGSTSQSDHSPTTMAADCQAFNDACVKILTIAGAVDGALDFSSWNSDGFTLVIDDAFTASYLIHYIAFGGTDITNVASVTASVTATGTTDVTSVGFQPDVAFVFCGDPNVAINTTTGWSQWGFGVVDTALTNYTLAGAGVDAIGTSQTASYCRSGECWTALDPSTPDATTHRASISAWLSNGFTVNTAQKVAGTSIARVLCVKGGQWKAFDNTTSTGTSNFSETGVGFQPVALIVGSHGKAVNAAGTASANDERSIGFATGATERSCASVIDKDNQANADIGVDQRTDAIYSNQSTATTVVVEGLMDLVSFDSDGVTVVMDDADPSAAFWFGLAAAGNAGFTLSADPGSFSVTGTAASLEFGREVAADPGSFTITGTAANLTRGRTLTADPGSVSLAGQAASLEFGRLVGAVPGAFTLTGTTASLEFGRELAADVGSVTIGGTAASLEFGREVAAAPGSVLITGTDATLIYDAGGGAFTLVADPGAFSLTGSAASLEFGREVGAEAGAFTLAGTAADLLFGREVGAEPGAVAVSGTAAALRLARLLASSPGAFTLTGTAATLTYDGAAPIAIGYLPTVLANVGTIYYESQPGMLVPGGRFVSVFEVGTGGELRGDLTAPAALSGVLGLEPERYTLAGELSITPALRASLSVVGEV